jgi:hypothetical protein
MEVELRRAPAEFAGAAELGIVKCAVLREKYREHQGQLLVKAALVHPNVRSGVHQNVSIQDRLDVEAVIRRDVEKSGGAGLNA